MIQRILRSSLAVLAAVISGAPLLAQTAAARIDSIFSFATSSTPGCAVATIRNGAVEYARGYGLADLEHELPITPRTPFYLASVSKQFTAGAINLLVVGKKLSLDDNVRKFIPELPDFGTPITIRHLLHHTSGLRDYFGLFDLAGFSEDFPITNADFLDIVGRQRSLNFPPGQQFSYTNTGYVLLSIVVERVSGKSLRVFAQERFFTPLAMSSTQFRDQHNMLIPRRASAYVSVGAGRFHMAVPHFDVVGDGGLYSTVEDLARWEGNFREPRVGGAEWLRLEGVRGRLNDGTVNVYGAGLNHGVYRGDSTVSHGGGLGGYNTALVRFPARRFSVAVLCNSFTVSSSDLAFRVADVSLGSVLAPAAAAPNGSPGSPRPSARELARYSGAFFSERLVLYRHLEVDGRKLYFVRGPTNRSELIPAGVRRFSVAGTPLVAVMSTNADTLRLELPDAPPGVFRRVSATGGGDVASYAGSYASGELGVTWKVAARKSLLTLVGPRGDSTVVTPAFTDAFIGPGVLVRFVRDARGAVVGMEASAGERARNVRFEKQGRTP